MAMPSDIKQPWAGLKSRVITSVVLIAIVLLAQYLGGLYFTALIMFAAMQMKREWDRLTAGDNDWWHLGGTFYVLTPCISLVWLRGLEIGLLNAETAQRDPTWGGACVVFFLILLVIATDVGAYFTGRQFGRFKLAPTISPNKTWEGLAGGVTAAAFAGGIFSSLTPFPTTFLSCIVCGAVIAVVAQLGDLFESWMKRRAGVKDSGRLLPGHGGLLDRVDGLTFSAPLMALLVLLSGAAS